MEQISTVAIAQKREGKEENPNAIKRRKAVERKVLGEEVDVACGSLMNVGSLHLRTILYSFILVDEAGQATEPETIVGLCQAEWGARVVCIGDHMQLPPTVRCR